MAKNLSGLGGSLGWLAGVLLCFALSASCTADNQKTNKMPSTNNVSQSPGSAPDDSARLAEKMRGLTELALPDEWYSAAGDTLAARFEAAAKAMRAKDPKGPTGPQLTAQFENGGKPFVHSVWFFHPLRCQKCNKGGSDGYQTVVSVRLGLSVTITAAELHAVTAHRESFAADRLSLLKKILDSP